MGGAFLSCDSDITLVLCKIEACMDGGLKTLHSQVRGVPHQGLRLRPSRF